MKYLKMLGNFILDAIAVVIILTVAITFAAGAALVASVVWTELTTDPKIWEPLGIIAGTVGGLIGVSAASVWAWARLNREPL